MPELADKNLCFVDSLIRAVLAVDAGQADTAVLTVARAGAVESFTVWGAWDGDVFSWRMCQGAYQTRPEVSYGRQLYAGHGDDLDATLAAGRAAWMCAGMEPGEWSITL